MDTSTQVQTLDKAVYISNGANTNSHCFNWDLIDDQTIWKMCSKKANGIVQAENSWYFQDTSYSLSA